MNEDELSQYPSNRAIPNPITGDERSVIFGLYDEMCILEYHYDKLQNTTKAFSMTWLAAGFLAVAYIIENYKISSIFSAPLELFFVFNLVAFGFYIHWFSDVSIYHRQLKAVFLSQQEFEKKYPYLGNVHEKWSLTLENRKKGTDPVKYHGQFYLRIVFALVCLSILTILPDALNNLFFENRILKYAAFIVVLIHSFFISILLITTKKSGATYKD